ncbi:MAG: DUF2087 domain-containing protein [Gammaproteobacteria bacterium]|nr:DUF2087 domain-containing protein [Gammaproteobacteria bacterium]
MASADDFLRAALDPVRLAILGQAILGRVEIDDLVAALGIDRVQVIKAIGRLRGVGLLEADLSILPETLRSIAAQLEHEAEPAPEIIAGPWTAKETQVLSHFFTGTRLKSIPAQRPKRRIVLDRLAQEFEIGVRYPEVEVNFILGIHYSDYATLRRYLVDEGFMARREGVYWRVGGRTER